MKKGFALGAYADNNPDHIRFRRQHSGEAPVPKRPLRPLWPLLAVALVLLALGLNFTIHAPNSGVARGGLFFMLLGVGVLAFFGWQLGREIDLDAP